MSRDWQGRAVSIRCLNNLGVFQGTIKEADPKQITIIRTFRNGLPFRSLDTEVTILAVDIEQMGFIDLENGAPNTKPSNNGSGPSSSNGLTTLPVAPNNLNHHPNTDSPLTNKLRDTRVNRANKSPTNPQIRNSAQKQPQTGSQSPFSIKPFGNMIPGKVEVQLGSSAPSTSSKQADFPGANAARNQQKYPTQYTASPASFKQQPTQKPIQNRNTVAYARNQAFGTSADDPIMDEEFDFEKNLALFDKKAIWTEIDAIQKPDLLKQTSMVKPKKNYRYDENVIVSQPSVSRQIITYQYDGLMVEFATDEGLVIPTIPLKQRQMVQFNAENGGLDMVRQRDMLAHGTAEMALMLLGGARRLTPNNQHQWPKIVVVCDESWNRDSCETGLATGRHLASHGLEVCVYLGRGGEVDRENGELELFEASGPRTKLTSSIKDLPSCDLVILSVKKGLKPPIIKWINDSRSQTLAIDPPVAGLGGNAPYGVPIKYSILPVLPVNEISAECGKLYLCNLGIPERFYHDAGISYRSPFGHKCVIPIHLMAPNKPRTVTTSSD